MRSLLFLLICVLSGAAALIYEVLWLRLLTLSMGHTTAAVGTVLAAFMGGLALGAWMGGRLAAALAPRRALRTYAALELTIAACAVLLPVVFTALQPVLRWAYANGDGGLLFTSTRVALSLLLISLPTMAMGATYPMAVRWFAGAQSAVGSRQSAVGGRQSAGQAQHEPLPTAHRPLPTAASAQASRVYAANTAGAALGVMLGGFALLPLLGMRGATFAAVAMNSIAAVGALLISRIGSVETAPLAGASAPAERVHATSSRSPTRPTRPTDAHALLAASALAVSGFVALVYEVIWTRILAMVLGPTTYAFSAMLLAFIAGLAIGAAAASALLPRTRYPGAWLGLVLLAAAGCALAAAAAVDRLPLLMAFAVTRPGTTFESVARLQVGLGIAMQLPMTIALGAAFPLAIAHVSPGVREVARAVGVVYAANTVGAIAGALAGSFLLIPALGLQTSLRLAAALTCVAGAVVGWNTVPRRGIRVAVAGLGAAGVVAAAMLPSWNEERLANGAYRYPPALAAGDLEIGLEAGRLLYYREGAAGTVSVRDLLGSRSLAIDGKVDASNADDMLTQKLLAHLPLMLHPRPHDVLIIGLGSGVTLGSALRHPIERATVLEISPEVVAASDLFSKENGQALADARTRLIPGDGRSHLLLSNDQYDVIVSEPSNPWMAGVAALFTREFFTAARGRLRPGGVLCQWAHTYSISDADLRSVVATFLSVFPDGSAWLIGEGDLLLIGSAAAPPMLDEALAESWQRPGVAEDLARVSLRDPFSLLTLFVAQGDALQRYADGALVQSDDRLALEYSAPRAIYSQFQDVNTERLRALAARAQPPPAVRAALVAATAEQWRNRGIMQLHAAAPALAYDDLRQAIDTAPHDVEALDGFARAAARSGQLADAEAFLSRVTTTTRSVPALVQLSKVLAARARSDEAANAARDAVLLEPANEAALEQLAWVYADRRDIDALEQLLRVVARSPAHRAVALYCRACIAHLSGDQDNAVNAGEELVTLNRRPNALKLLGSIRAAREEFDLARQALEASLEIEPADVVVRMNLGVIELRASRPAAAVERFSEVLSAQPTLAPALDGLAQAYEQLGERRRADTVRRLIR
ncbi:MAG TPA: hypothetical protein VIX63_12075 [Vicinamibacterales bacterium]